MLFLTLKKIRIVKIAHPQIPNTIQKIDPPQPHFAFPLPLVGVPTHPLMLFGKPCISHNGKTWHSYTLPKEDQKNI